MKLNGEVVNTADQKKLEAFLQLNNGQGTVNDCGSCNQFRGGFKTMATN
jgi:hypothetical protein